MSAIDANALLTMIGFAVPFLIVAISWIMDYTGAKSNKRKREEADANFGKVVADLSSDSPATQLSAAFLLRRYFSMKIGKENYLHTATVGVISSILRTLPTGIFQKTVISPTPTSDAPTSRTYVSRTSHLPAPISKMPSTCRRILPPR